MNGCKYFRGMGLRGPAAVLVAAALAVAVSILWGCRRSEPVVPAVAPAPSSSSVRAAPAQAPDDEGKLVTIFCGAAGRPPIEEVADAFEREHGVVVARAYGGSGTVLSQMIIGETGDVYIPGSDDFMDIAAEKGVIVEGTRRLICYLVPCIGVQRGNPKGIESLEDLTKPGIRVGIGNPRAVCLGDIAMKIFDAAGIRKEVKPNIVTHADSCGQIASLLKLRQVDAVIGWDVFENWAPGQIEAIPIPRELARERHIPAAVVKFTHNRALAQKFVDFISGSEESREIFERHGYTVREPS
ncbi:MAG: molybdate ABC transporter substrate-binding protein [Armatimonadota bacterium]